MAAPRRIKDLLAEKASHGFVGRQRELAALLDGLAVGGPVVTWIQGPSGMGKSSLLAEFARRAGERGATVVALDARAIEPTEPGFRQAVADRVPEGPCVLVIDSYECFLLIDTWLRQDFIPELDSRVRVVIASRFPPTAPWLVSLAWQDLFRVMSLEPLPPPDAIHFLRRAGLTASVAERLNRMAQGHPLALRLALAAAPRARNTEPIDVIQQLAALYWESIADPAARHMVEAASVVHCVTRPLLQAMLPEAPANAYDLLAASSFVEPAREGLVLHEAIREAVAARLQASDPHRHQALRRAAWGHLRSEAKSANRQRMWSCTSGMIYLLRNPVARDAFFPPRAAHTSVEPAQAEDGAAILEMIRRHETPAAARLLERWWDVAPQAFRAVRDGGSAARGFSIFLELHAKNQPRLEEDPLASHWRRHLRQHPLAPGETAVFLRRWLDAERGESPSAVQAACWLDVKRSYLELRPHLRRCYLALSDLATYGPGARKLGFEVVSGAATHLDGVTHQLVVLDFGPGSVDGWLTELVAQELGVRPDSLLDTEARELIHDGQRVALTALEFELLRHLEEHAGKAVSRAELLDRVWGQHGGHAGSNVVDVLVRGLRKKMGSAAARLATVRGHGYVLRLG